MRVLIADADEAFLEILQSFLWDRGHEVEIASDGLECLSMLHEFLPAVVLLDRDLLWGGADGVIAQMCEDPNLADIPVILVTDDDRSELPPGNIHRRLRKPFRLADALACINSIGRAACRITQERPEYHGRVGVPYL